MYMSLWQYVKRMSVYVEHPSVNVFDCIQLHFRKYGFVCVPAFVHSPQVHTGERRATLVPFAGVR